MVQAEPEIKLSLEWDTILPGDERLVRCGVVPMRRGSCLIGEMSVDPYPI